jgi:hypothetical protein
MESNISSKATSKHAAFNSGIVDASTYPGSQAAVVAPQHVVITGLGRGGTTALAQIFQALGFSFANANAVMENVTYRTLLQEKRLDELKGIFDGFYPLERTGWKDPKLRSAMGLELINTFSPEVGVAIIFRDLLATSLRNNMTMDWALMDALEKAVHESKKLVALAQSIKGRPLLLISYEKLILETELVVRQIADWTKISNEERIGLAIRTVQPSSDSYLQVCLDSTPKK